MANLIALYRLQQVDRQLEEASQELNSLNSSDSGSNDFKEAEAALEKGRGEKREAERVLKNAELELATLETEKKQTEDKLYSGKITNSKELSQLERDIQQLTKRRDKLDEQVLNGMEKLENANQTLKVKEKLFEEAKSTLEREKNARESRVARLSQQLEELKLRRENFTRSLDEMLLEQYASLKERKAGLAIASLKKNSCSACYMMVSESTIQKVKTLELEYCSSCGRILYLDKEI